MANRRMFSRDIVKSDLFLDLPISAQALYFHLGMDCDDDGFCGNPKMIMRMTGCNIDDLKLLIVKGFVQQFDSGVIVITHWKTNNYIRSDRYRETIYRQEKSMLCENCGVYIMDTNGIPMVDQRLTQYRIGEDKKYRVGKEEPPSPTRDQSDIPTDDEATDFERLFDYTFEKYPKKSAPAVARQVWCRKISSVVPANRKAVAKLLFDGMQAYIDDYSKNNEDDIQFRYIPKFSEWVEQYSDYWIKKAEKRQQNGGA